MIVEAVCSPQTLDLPALRRVLQFVDAWDPIALHNPDRCALQLRVQAEGASEAVDLAVERWRAAASEVGHLTWEVVRAEAMTLEEFDQECHAAYSAGGDPAFAAVDEDALTTRVGYELLRSAFEDPLTGMQTSGALECRLEEAAAAASDTFRTGAVLVLDLDGFQALNEAHGTAAGDCVLAAVAQRLGAVVTEVGTLARVGGDRFALLLETASEESAVSTAGRLLDALRPPFNVDAGDVTVTATVGVAQGRIADGRSLMDQATRALLAAKASNRGGVEVFDPASEQHRVVVDCPEVSTSEVAASLRLLTRAATTAATSATLPRAAATLLPHICAFASWPVAQLCVLDGAGRLRPTHVSYSSDRERFRAVRRTIARPPSARRSALHQRVLHSRRPEWGVALHGGVLGGRSAEPQMRTVVVVPVLVGNEVVAALEFFGETPRTPEATVLETLALVGVHLGSVGASHGRTISPTVHWTPGSVPFRYELFGWEPEQPGPGLDAFVSPRGTGTGGGRDLRQTLTRTYERLAGSVAGRETRQ